MENKNAVMLAEDEMIIDENLDFDALEEQLQSELAEDIAEVEFLEEERNKIGNPVALGDVVMDVVVEQFNNQIAMIAGEEFVKNNNGLSLDLRDEAHIQTAENFAVGKIAEHNHISRDSLKTSYDRYKNTPHKEFRDKYVDPGMNATLKRAGQLNKEGVKTVKDIYTGKQIPTNTKLENGQNNPNAAQREHVIPSAKIYQDPALQMGKSNEELAGIINNPENLQGYTTAERNNRKNDKSVDEMEKRDKTAHHKKANERAEKYIEDEKKKNEERLKEEGRKTQKEEFKKIGKEVLKSMFFQMLAELLKDVIKKLVEWFRKTKRKISELYTHVKEAIKNFFKNIKERILGSAQSASITVLTAIYKPIGEFFSKFWAMIKQGWKSLKEAYTYLKSDEAKNQPFSIKVMQVGKIIVAGLTAIGAIVLGSVITEASKAIPVIGPFLAAELPIIGSLASIFGLFMGALISGIVGAIVINFMDKFIAKKQQSIVTGKIIDKNNEILHKQAQLQVIAQIQNDKIKEQVADSIHERHQNAHAIMEESLRKIFANDNSEDVVDVEDVVVIAEVEDEEITYKEYDENVMSMLDDMMKR